jgi:cell division protein FtsI/penicillin-binding protein 2
VVLAGLVAAGMTSVDFDTESSAEPVVQTFLLEWQQGHYTSAAKLTNGGTTDVSDDLSHAFRNLNATAMFMSMGSVKQHGDSAEATFGATVDLAGGGHQWTYQGHFGLTRSGGHWLVNWAPSVIEPNLGAGDRLSVVTKFSPRGQVTDSTGQPLIPESGIYYIGVYPGKLADARTTANSFSRLTGLNAEQVLGQVSSAPPQQFLPLLTVDPDDFADRWPALSRVSGMTEIYSQARLFNYDLSNPVGAVGTENSNDFLQEGAAYQPGATIGESGLELAYQDSLEGTPDISVIVVNPQGHTVATLWTSHGVPGTPLPTTINGPVQAAANQALSASGSSGQVVAVDAATGRVLALAGRNTGDLKLPGTPASASLAPGGAFSIVSAAALLANGLQAGSPLPCQNTANVGGQTYRYTAGPPSSSTFSSDFAKSCATAFATASLRLSGADLAAAEKEFGLGAPWSLPPSLAAFSGSAATATSEAALAGQAIGATGVKMSPLGMALVAAEVESGTGHAPVLLPSAAAAASPAQSWQLSLSPGQLTALRTLMRATVTSGVGRAVNLPGAPVYGQAGSAQQGPGSWVSWFVGYRSGMAFAVVETGRTQAQAAASLARTFLSSLAD